MQVFREKVEETPHVKQKKLFEYLQGKILGSVQDFLSQKIYGE